MAREKTEKKESTRGTTRAAGKARAPARHRVADIMIQEAVTIDPTATLAEAAQRMREANVGMLPLVEHGVLRGVLTDRDLAVRAVAQGLDPSRTTAAECATMQNLVTARPGWSADEALRVMAERQVGRLPVTDDDGRLLGVVSLSSLVLRSGKERPALETAKAVSKRSARVA
jgi:CBS domain-containing protein